MTERKFRINPLVIMMLLFVLFYYGSSLLSGGNNAVSYAELRELFVEEKVTEFTIRDHRLTARLNDDTTAVCVLSDTELFYDDMHELVVAQKEAGIITDYTYTADHSPDIMPYIVAALGFFVLLRILSRQNGAGPMNDKMARFGEARTTTLGEGDKRVTFDDVAGADEEKEELQEIVSFLKDPQKFIDLGAHIPKGVLLVGPPGTGKTLLAKAVAGEANVKFLSISGSDFVEMYVGVGASRVRDLFEQAKKDSPAIVFIDEIDAVGRQRGSGLGGGHDEREQTLNQLLVEMDGFGVNEGVVVLAATNRVDILDPALLRPGRFDRQVYVGLPDSKGREAILNIHARNKPLAEDVDLKKVAQTTAGFTGADLENLLNEAALLTGRQNKHFIDAETIEEASIKVIAGPEKRSRIIPEAERRLTAYHEAGHGVAMQCCEGQDPVRRITIVPRGQAGGMTIHAPEEDRSYLSRKYMENRLVCLLGGRCAEALVLGDISTGAGNDLQRATELARKMVGVYGMSDKLGVAAFDAGSEEVFVGKSMGHTRAYSEATAAVMDEEIRAILDSAYDRCMKLLEANRDALERVAQYLLERETMDGDTFRALFHDGKQ